jgi:hypothetical protein
MQLTTARLDSRRQVAAAPWSSVLELQQDPHRLARLTVALVFLVALACGLLLAPARADAATGLISGVPPLRTRVTTTPEGKGQVTLRMLVNPQVLAVYTARCGDTPTKVTIQANNHYPQVLLSYVPAGACVTVAITGLPTPVVGELSY